MQTTHTLKGTQKIFRGQYGSVQILCAKCSVAYLHGGDIYTCNRVEPGSVVGVSCFGLTMLLIVFRCVLDISEARFRVWVLGTKV